MENDIACIQVAWKFKKHIKVEIFVDEIEFFLFLLNFYIFSKLHTMSMYDFYNEQQRILE